MDSVASPMAPRPYAVDPPVRKTRILILRLFEGDIPWFTKSRVVGIFVAIALQDIVFEADSRDKIVVIV